MCAIERSHVLSFYFVQARRRKSVETGVVVFGSFPSTLSLGIRAMSDVSNIKTLVGDPTITVQCFE